MNVIVVMIDSLRQDHVSSHRGISETKVKGIQGKYELASGGIF